MAGPRRPPVETHGITDADRERIAAYLQKPAHERSLDDLCRAAED